MVFIYRCFIAGLCDFTITFYLYIFLSMDFLSEINYMYVCMYNLVKRLRVNYNEYVVNLVSLHN